MLPNRPSNTLSVLILLAAWIHLLPVRAENIVFPSDAGVIDVSKPPYSAPGDGVSDATEALQQALLENGNQNRILYLPNGTYRIAAPLLWPKSSDPRSAGRLILQGQSREKTIIQLFDYLPAYSNSGRPEPMVKTGIDGENNLRNAVRNLTLHTGMGNPGTIGLQFLANQQGCVRDVDIIAGGDGSGSIGLDLSFADRMGPLLAKSVRIRGFDTGIRTASPIFSVTMEDIELSGQKSGGIRNSAQVLTVRHLRSTNSGPAIQNVESAGFVTLLDAECQALPAKRPSPAIINRGILVVRNLATPGYTNAIENRSGHGVGTNGPVIHEYQSHTLFSQFPAPPYTLNLPVEETPQPSWDPLEDWVSPVKFGGKPERRGDDSEAIQKAIDSGATTVYLPNGTWTLNSPVVLRGKVRRIIGTEAELILAMPEGQSAFLVTNTTAATVWFERLQNAGTKNPLVDLGAERRLVFLDCTGVSLSGDSKAEIFLEDVSSSTSLQLHRGQSLWARSWFQQFQGAKVVNRGGIAWLMGFTTARPGTLINTLADGKTELLGGLCFSSGSVKQAPMFRIEDASASLVIAEASLSTSPYEEIVLEIRKGIQRKMRNTGLSGDQPLPEHLGGVAVPLYTGYFGVGAVEPRTAATKPKTSP